MRFIKCGKCGSNVMFGSRMTDNVQEQISNKEKEATQCEREIERIRREIVKVNAMYNSKIKQLEVNREKEISALQVNKGKVEKERNAATHAGKELRKALKQLSKLENMQKAETRERIINRILKERLNITPEEFEEIDAEAERRYSIHMRGLEKEIKKVYGESVETRKHNEWHTANGVYDPTARNAIKG